MQHFRDYRQKYSLVLALILLLIYFKLYSQTNKAKRNQPLSSEIKMNHDHDHAAMMASSTPISHHDHPTETNNIVSGGSGLHMMMMAMTFHGGFKETILFEKWKTDTVGEFIGSWFLIFFLAAFYEGLKTFRDVLAQRDLCDTCAHSTNRSRTLARNDDQQYVISSDNDLIPSTRIQNQQINRARLLSLSHMIQTLLHILQMTISYFLMLIAMTYNTYLIVGVVLGAGLGHFLFGWRRSSVLDHNEHCH